MVKTVFKLVEQSVALDMLAVFNALDVPVLVLDGSGVVHHANNAAEQFFARSLSSIQSERLSSVIIGTQELENLTIRAIEQRISITESALEVTLNHTHNQRSAIIDITAAPIADMDGYGVLHLHERTLIQQIERRLGYLGAARSITGMASVLAHEIKNPLSGIRGASQLLEETASEPDQQLTALIRDEVDRICELVDRMGDFSSDYKINKTSVNIHKVLDRVHQIAENGFAKDTLFTTLYDPSLPPVAGDQDLLIQVFLNLVKNAAEAATQQGVQGDAPNEITLTTAYRPGIRLSLSGEQAPQHLPLVVEVSDNGPGIPFELHEHLFEPFITTKPHGNGFGLPLSAKIIADHGGMVDFDSKPGQTVFRVLLPIKSEEFGMPS